MTTRPAWLVSGGDITLSVYAREGLGDCSVNTSLSASASGRQKTKLVQVKQRTKLLYDDYDK